MIVQEAINEEIRKAFALSGTIAQAIGEASMCWSKTPDGEFDSTRAVAIVERLQEEIYDSAIRFLDVHSDTRVYPG